jgi:hypothetical protein
MTRAKRIARTRPAGRIPVITTAASRTDLDRQRDALQARLNAGLAALQPSRGRQSETASPRPGRPAPERLDLDERLTRYRRAGQLTGRQARRAAHKARLPGEALVGDVKASKELVPVRLTARERIAVARGGLL